MARSIKLPIFFKNDVHKSVFVVNTKNDSSLSLITKTYISELGELEIRYNYTTDANTFQNSDAKTITRNDFYAKVKEIKENHKVQITIKL